MHRFRDTHTFSITHTTKDRLPRLPFFEIKNMVLGKKYELSFVCTGNSLSRKLNMQYRRKDKPANVLSFPLGGHRGELFIDLTEAKKEGRVYRESLKKRVGILFIHGILHLKGFTHGSTMNVEEVKIRKKFHVA